MFAVLSLSACGTDSYASATRDNPTRAAVPADTTAADVTASAPATPDPVESELPVKGTGMAGGCDALHETFLALDAGDALRAQGYRLRAEDLFNAVADKSATDLESAREGASLVSVLQEFTPDRDTYRRHVGPDYRDICVEEYKAPALDN